MISFRHQHNSGQNTRAWVLTAVLGLGVVAWTACMSFSFDRDSVEFDAAGVEPSCDKLVCTGGLCCEDPAPRCVDTPNDPLNCGGCGVVCGPGETCEEGTCRCGLTAGGGASACLESALCCDGVCTVIAFDPEHCGGCGQVCGDANGKPDCVQKICEIACEPGFADCNLDGATVGGDGCEANLADDPLHCGVCGAVCGVGAVCEAGLCRCPGNTVDVCKAQSNTHTGGTCEGGLCKLTCVPSDRGNCDALGNTGCEVDLMTNGEHCRACNVSCSGGECAGGVCQ